MASAPPETWTPKPARGYSWPPFAPQNTQSMRHGIWSKRKVDPLAEDLVAGVLSDRDDLGNYPEVLMAWARAEARCLLLDAWFAERGLFDDEGKERPGLRFIHQFERLASELRAQLGLTPGSEADLARSRADAIKGELDLEGLAARGREARLAAEQRQAVEAGPSSPLGGELAGPASATGAIAHAGSAEEQSGGRPAAGTRLEEPGGPPSPRSAHHP
jgi:hypothetical protein